MPFVPSLVRDSPLFVPDYFQQLTMQTLCSCVYQGRTVVSPYVGMARKQNGGSNGCISNYTTITQLRVGFIRFKAPTCRIRTLPSPTKAPKLPESIAKVVNRQPGKIRFSSFSSSSFSSSSSSSSSSSARLAL